MNSLPPPVTRSLLSDSKLHDWWQHQWYQTPVPNAGLRLLEAVFLQAVRLRRQAYRNGLRKRHRLPVPVVVVGNLTVGGVGKTPLVIWLAGELSRRGLRPGIVSRGYGGNRTHQPLGVVPDSDPADCGDEPVLIARRTGCPVVVARQRVAAARYLLATTDCNVLIADDGLQHYALERDVEIAVIDGLRRFGNGHCLPAGPLREPPARLEQVDRIIYSGTGPDGASVMVLEGEVAINLVKPDMSRPLTDFQAQPLYAMAGIGHPSRFFDHLEARGLRPEARVYPDHHVYTQDDLPGPSNRPLLMTEKDAVKCTRFADSDCWYVPVQAKLPPDTADSLCQLIIGKL